MASRTIVAILVMGFVIRLAVAWPYYSGDVNTYTAWAKEMVEHGTWGFYDRDFPGHTPPNYPPLSLYLFGIFYLLYLLVTEWFWQLNLAIPIFPSFLVPLLQWENSQAVFLKLPAMVGDVVLAYFLFMLSKKLAPQSRWPVVLVMLYLFNPAIFYNSASWGQIESLPMMLVMAALYFLTVGKAQVAGLVFVGSLLMKQTAIIFVPVLAIAIFRSMTLKQIAKLSVLAYALIVITYLPFGLDNPLVDPLINYWQHLGGVANYLTVNAFNWWALMFGLSPVSDTKTFLDLSLGLWGYLWVLALSAPLFAMLWKHYSFSSVASVMYLVSLITFLFLTRMHERHLFQVLPLLLLASIFYRNLLVAYVIVSILHFINLYHGFWQPDLWFLNVFLSEMSGQLPTAFFILMVFAVLYLWQLVMFLRKR